MGKTKRLFVDRQLLLVTIACVWGGSCLSQAPLEEKPARTHTLTLRAGHTQLKENNLHPFVFRGLHMGVTYGYALSKNSHKSFSAGLESSLHNTRLEQFPSAASLMLVADYKHRYTLYAHSGIHYALGPAGYARYGTNMFFNWDESHLYYANFLGAGISQRLLYPFRKCTIGLELDIPLFAMAHRPEPNRQYKIDDMTFTGIVRNLTANPHLALPWHMAALDAVVQLSDHTHSKRTIGYHFRHLAMHVHGSRPFRNIQHNLLYVFQF
jgi:hypothetical protein